MKAKYVLFLILIVDLDILKGQYQYKDRCYGFTISQSEEDKIFEDYAKKFKLSRSARTVSETSRYNVIKRYKMIQRHNERFRRGLETFEMELNKFAHLSNEILSSTSLGVKINQTSSHSANAITVPLISGSGRGGREMNLPEYFNWNDIGIVRPVQDQGSCGSCYAFAAIAAIESAVCRTYSQCQKLSEQEAMECTALCSGGWDDWIYSYSINSGGCTSSTYEYYGYKRQECSAAKSRKRIQNTRVKGWYLLPNDEKTIRNYLFRFGPVSVVFNVHENFYYYKSGIYSSVDGDWTGAHAVLLTGYGTENGTSYWIIKNSWGVEFGERGYFRMQRGINLNNIEGWKVSIPIV